MKKDILPSIKKLIRVFDFTALAGTIRGRVLLAFVAISIITGGLGSYMSTVIGRAGELVAMTYDRSLMSINYARAAAADFAAMEAAGARRWSTSEPAAAAELESTISTLEASLLDDLTIAGQRAQSPRAAAAAEAARAAAIAWSEQRRILPIDIGAVEGWKFLKVYSEHVTQQIDLLINYTAGSGFTYRQSALAAVSQNIQLAVAATALALFFSAVVAWVLSQYIIGAVATASSVADNIAKGRLECEVPQGPRDELGHLLGAMAVMRDNIRAMMEREVNLRQSAQLRLADALESSREGIVVLNAEGSVTLANSRALEFFGPSLHEAGWLKSLPLIDASAAAGAVSEVAPIPTADLTGEVRLPDGRWLRACQSSTSEGGYIAIFSDITVMKEQKEKLKSANDLLDAALDNMSQGLGVFNSERRLMMVNRRFCEIFEVASIEAITGIDSRCLQCSIEPACAVNMDIRKLLAEEKHYNGQRTKGPRFIELSGGRVIAVNRQPFADGGWVATYEDVTVQRRAEAQVTYLARHDVLTDLTNRVVFAERIEQEIGRISRSGKSFAVLCLDLDHFKPINDSLGHPAGDTVLRTVAERLKSCVRESDTVSRLGGDEFAILLQDLTDPEDVETIAARIIREVGEPYMIEGQPASIGVSIGISIAPQDGRDYEKLLKNADIALYLSKSEGRGTWRYFETEMEERLQARRAMEFDLKRALDENQFEVFYQPLMDLHRNEVCGFEALLRWRHPDRGMVSPAEFIPIAEEMGFIVPLGRWVMHRACTDALSWPPHVKVAVNVSAVQFKRDSLVETVKSVLAETGISPARLELEITESVLLARTIDIMSTLHELRDLGIEISMDDFGTGYSSLSYLRSFPFDKIKIDRSFVAKPDSLDGSRAIVLAMVALGANLGIRTIAEGVETRDQAAWLKSIGCHEAQGYYFSPPVPLSAVPAMLEKLGCAGMTRPMAPSAGQPPVHALTSPAHFILGAMQSTG